MKEPTYKTIASNICDLISRGELRIGDAIPSFNAIREKYGVSRDTAIKAYRELKSRGIVDALPGKNFYVSSANITFHRKIFLLFDELSIYKSVLYNSFLEAISGKIPVEIYFHHFNFKIFKNLLIENIGKYTDYIIMPLYHEQVPQILNTISNRNKVYFIDQGYGYFTDKYAYVCQDFKNDIIKILQRIYKPSLKFTKFIMQINDPENPSEEFMVNQMKSGFTEFFSKSGLDHKIHKSINTIEKGVLYFIYNDSSLFQLIKLCWSRDIKIGRDIGIISFNDTPYKEVIEKGVSTISSDFIEMGKSMAGMVLENKMESIINPVCYIERNTFRTSIY